MEHSKYQKNKIAIHQIVRNSIQLVSFLLLPGLFIDSFNGIKAVIQGIIKNDMSGVVGAVFPTTLLIAATAIFGKFFCGFLCSFGTMGDAVNFVGRKLFQIKFKIPETIDGILKKMKYVILVVILGIWMLGIPVLEGANPWNAFGSLLSFPPDFTYVFNSLLIGLILLIGIIIGSLFVERFFCRYFCPMGAVFSLVSHLRIAKLKKPRKSCGNCRLCTNHCKMGIPLYRMDSINSGECIDCMQCISPCPRENIHLTITANDAAPLAASVMAASTIGLYYIGNIGVNAFTGGSPSSAIVSAAPKDTYTDGVFEGSGTGFHNGTTTVSVTIKSGKISDIQTVSTLDDAPYYNKAFSSVTAGMIAAQDTSVNAVSGATFSSRGIMEAVSNALEKAKG